MCRTAPAKNINAKKTRAVPAPEAVPTPDKFPEGFARCSRGEAEWITLEQPRNFPASGFSKMRFWMPTPSFAWVQLGSP